MHLIARGNRAEAAAVEEFKLGSCGRKPCRVEHDRETFAWLRLEIVKQRYADSRAHFAGSDDRLPVRNAYEIAARRCRAIHCAVGHRSEEHTSELQSLMRISYAVFCLKKKNTPSNQIKLTT